MLWACGAVEPIRYMIFKSRAGETAPTISVPMHRPRQCALSATAFTRAPEMKNVGALKILTQEQQRLHLVDPSNLNSIRLIDDTLHLDVDSLAKMEEEEESTVYINSPETVLRYLIFPYLDPQSLVQPVCKLWTQLAGCNLLWKSLFHRYFDAAPARWSIGVKEHDWKLHFRYAISNSK